MPDPTAYNKKCNKNIRLQSAQSQTYVSRSITSTSSSSPNHSPSHSRTHKKTSTARLLIRWKHPASASGWMASYLRILISVMRRKSWRVVWRFWRRMLGRWRGKIWSIGVWFWLFLGFPARKIRTSHSFRSIVMKKEKNFVLGEYDLPVFSNPKLSELIKT